MRRGDAQPGYTLIELLLAMGLFAIGMIAVASIFPAAAHMQRATIEQATSKRVGHSAQALLLSRPSDATDMRNDMTSAGYTDWDTDERLRPLPAPASTTDWRDAALRSYPSELVTAEIYDRGYYWLPLVRDTDNIAGASNDSFEYVILVLRRPDNLRATTAAGYDDRNPTRSDSLSAPFLSCANLDTSGDAWNIPVVFEIECTTNVGSSTFDIDNLDAANEPLIAAGDLVVDCYGNNYRVIKATATNIEVAETVGGNSVGQGPESLWFARAARAGDPSPLRLVHRMTDYNADTFVPSVLSP